MKKDTNKIAEIYSGKVARKYEYSMPPFFLRWKRKAFFESALKRGDQVLVFCCGTGLDFPYILEKIGSDGKIVAVDFSAEMLKQATAKIEKNNWKNIELIQADVTSTEMNFKGKFDVGVCTLGLSIIPDFMQGYNNLFNSVKQGGEIIIGDMQLASGWLKIFNPLTIHMASKFGGSHPGHKNSLKILANMKNNLKQIRKRVFFLGAYFYCIGIKS